MSSAMSRLKASVQEYAVLLRYAVRIEEGVLPNQVVVVALVHVQGVFSHQSLLSFPTTSLPQSGHRTATRPNDR